MSEKYHRAARDGYLDALRDGNRKEMNTTDEDGCTPAMLAAQHGNLDALRLVIMRGGDVNKSDLLGSTALHHAARHGHMNCVTFLVNFGANFWMLDNDLHAPIDIAALENREDIMKFLDDAQSVQERKNPKIVQQLREKATRESEKNAKLYEKLQAKASKEMEKNQRKIDRYDTNNNSGFTQPTEKSFVKKLTLRMKGNTSKLKALNTKNGSTSAFSDLANGTTRKSTPKTMPDTGFHVSDMDEQGNRTIRSLSGKGTVVRNNAQVLYVADSEASVDYSSRPALTNVFTGTSLDEKKWNRPKDDSNVLEDSGIDSFESGTNVDDNNDEAPGIFNRPSFGQISFLNRIDHMNITSFNDTDAMVPNDELTQNGDSAVNDRSNISADSLESFGSSNEATHTSPWHTEDVETLLDDDDDDNEYTPVVMFLAGCGLPQYTHLFTNGDVDMDTLMLLTNQDFQEMELPMGPRRKLMNAIQRRRVVLAEPAQMHDTHL